MRLSWRGWPEQVPWYPRNATLNHDSADFPGVVGGAGGPDPVSR